MHVWWSDERREDESWEAGTLLLFSSTNEKLQCLLKLKLFPKEAWYMYGDLLKDGRMSVDRLDISFPCTNKKLNCLLKLKLFPKEAWCMYGGLMKDRRVSVLRLDISFPSTDKKLNCLLKLQFFPKEAQCMRDGRMRAERPPNSFLHQREAKITYSN